MPTISQLPAATTVSAADAIPISQGGTAKAASIGAILQAAQPVISIASQSLLGRTSLGAGGPEQIDLGQGLALNGATLCANGLDHASFPQIGTLASDSQLVVSYQGSPMLMPASLLRGLFAPGSNVAISAGGVISATGSGGDGSTNVMAQVVTQLSTQDLLPVNQAGTNCAIAYGNLINGLTINQAQHAGAVGDSDTFWSAQGSDVMASQNFAAVWSWIATKLPLYQTPVIELTANINLDPVLHNARILICSQPITITAVAGVVTSGFRCELINASSGVVTLGTGFVSSTGATTLTSWQSAFLLGVTYSGGTVTYASISGTAGGNVLLPGQVGNVSSSGAGTTFITVSWQAPQTGPTPAGYIPLSRVSGTSVWTTWPEVASTTFQATGLTPSTSYDFAIQAAAASGTGPASTILTVTTAAGSQGAVPPQVIGLAATVISRNAVRLAWTSQTGAGAATGFTVQYRISGTSSWTTSVSGVTGNGTTVSGLQTATSYDFLVYGSNSAGAGPASAIVTTITPAAPNSVTSITWNMLPSGTYAKGSGSIGVNANVSPPTSAVQFGFSLSPTMPPSTWTQALFVNSNLWGAYLPAPATAGTWYAWAEGLDGSAPTVSSTSFTVQ